MNITNKLEFIVKIILLVAFVFLYHKKNEISTATNQGIDFWEYQTVATNLAEHNIFPVLGFIGPQKDYYINSTDLNAKDAYIFCRFKQISPVAFFEKPPLYGFLLGLSYKMFGNNLSVAYFLNLLLFTLSFIILLFIAKRFFKSNLFSITILALILYFAPLPLSKIIAPFYLLFFLFNLITLFCYKYIDTKKTTYLLAYALTFSILLLTNGVLIFYLLLTLFILIFKTQNAKSSFFKLATISATVLLIIIPWLIFTNTSISNNKTSFEQTKQEVLKSKTRCDTHTENLLYFYASNTVMKKVVEQNKHHDIVTAFFDGYFTFKKLTFFSNQVKSSDFLAIHNELSIDGHIHFEWEQDASLFYNTTASASSFHKILLFYQAKPIYFFKIYKGKISRATQNFPLAFFLFLILVFILITFPKSTLGQRFIILLLSFAAFLLLKSSFILGLALFILLFAPFHILLRKKHLFYISAVWSSLLVLLLFYGAERFITFMFPFLSLLSCSILFKLLSAKKK